jgi:hypothetical protein
MSCCEPSQKLTDVLKVLTACRGLLIAVMVKAVSTSETSVKTKRCNIPEGSQASSFQKLFIAVLKLLFMKSEDENGRQSVLTEYWRSLHAHEA